MKMLTLWSEIKQMGEFLSKPISMESLDAHTYAPAINKILRTSVPFSQSASVVINGGGGNQPTRLVTYFEFGKG